MSESCSSSHTRGRERGEDRVGVVAGIYRESGGRQWQEERQCQSAVSVLR